MRPSHVLLLEFLAADLAARITLLEDIERGFFRCS